jgi:hypothetical protein
VLFDVQERIQRQTMARLGLTEALAS